MKNLFDIVAGQDENRINISDTQGQKRENIIEILEVPLAQPLMRTQRATPVSSIVGRFQASLCHVEGKVVR